MTAGLKAKLDGAEVLPDGTVQVRLQKTFADASGTETALGFYRTVITPLTDSAAQLDAANAELAASGFGALSPADRATILELAAALQTEDRRAAYAAALAAAGAFPPGP